MMHPMEEFWLIRLGQPEFDVDGRARTQYLGMEYFIDDEAYRADEGEHALAAFSAERKARVFVAEEGQKHFDPIPVPMDREELYRALRTTGISHICVDPPPDKESFEQEALELRLIFPYEDE